MPQNKSDDLSDEEDDRLSDEDRDDGKIDEDDKMKMIFGTGYSKIKV